MPDHLHMCLRGALEDSPEAIAIGYMNESCRKLGVVGLWRPSYYVGTTGAYNMSAVRSYTPWASGGASPSGSRSGGPEFLATRLGLQTGQARLGAVRAFLGARQTVQRRSRVTLSGHPTGGETAPDGLAPSDAHGSKLEM